MAVITHAPTPPTCLSLPVAGDYTALPPHVRDQFSDLLEQADTAATGDAYHDAMRRACHTIGIAVPNKQDIAVCDCLYDGCGCGAIFDSHQVGVVVTATNDPGYNLSRLQCPDCGHDHPRPITD